MQKNKDPFEQELKLLVWELRDHPYRRFLNAFFLVWAIPFLTLIYLLWALKGMPQTSIRVQIPFVLFFLLLISSGGFVLAHQMIKKMVDKLSDYFIRAKRADELKSKFVALISHELKSPLMVLRTDFTNLSAGFAGKVTEDQKALLDVCQQVIDRMDQLIHEVLDLYKIQAGMIDLKRETCDLRDLLLSQTHELQPLFDKKNIGLSIHLPPAPLTAEVDKQKLTCVFNNLLSNSLKYTSLGSKVSIHAWIDGNYIRFEFSNSGFIIPEDKLKAIFDKFEKLDPAQEGYGLGLPISKDIVESHQGNIWAENRQNKNCFIIYLPKKAGKT